MGPSDSGYPKCGDGVKAGAPCKTEGEMCDADLGCNANMICAEKDPKQFGCPISKREYKTDIRYLGPEHLSLLYDRVLQMPLATFRYNHAAPTDRPQLGFIIEDVSPSAAVYDKLGKVDLYGYTSLAVGAIQAQAREIEALNTELDTMRTRLQTLEARLNKLEGHK